MNYEIDKNDSRLLIVRFNNKTSMNNALSKISKRYEQIETIAEGYNFPASFVEKNKKNKIEYVIGIYSGKSFQHEKLHAKYFFKKNRQRMGRIG